MMIYNQIADFYRRTFDNVFSMFRLESYLLYIFYIWSAWTLTSTTVKCKNLTLDCTNRITLTSPNYPSNYPNDASEEWYITAPRQRRILITFDDFSLELVDDTVVIKDMVISLNKKSYTGENMNFSPFLSQGYILYIKFTSSDKIRRKGFHISLTCYNTSSAIAILVDGNSPSEGFLQLTLESGERMGVCEESLPSIVAEIICKELGYPGVNEISYFNDTCLLEGHCTRAPSCQDNMYRTVDCTTPGHSICSSNISVKLKCNDVGFKGCYDFRSIELRNGSSFQSKEQCIFSCREENTKPIAIMNHTDCFCSTDDEIEDIQRGPDTPCTGTPASKSMMSVYSAFLGLCKELNDTTGGSWDSKITSIGSIVHLTCMNEYSLNGNGTLQCVPGSSPLNPVWNDSITHCIKDGSTTPKTEQDKVKIIVPVVLVFIILVFVVSGITYWKARGKFHLWVNLPIFVTAGKPFTSITGDPLADAVPTPNIHPTCAFTVALKYSNCSHH